MTVSRPAPGPTRVGWVVTAAGCAAALLLPRLLVAHPLTGVAVLVGAPALVLLLLHPRAALLAFVAASPFENYLSKDVSPSATKGLGAVVFAAFTLKALAGTRRRGAPQASLWWLAAFVLLVLAATTAHPNGALGLSTLIRYLSYTAICAVGFLVLREGDTLRVVCRVFVLSCCAASVSALVTFLSGPAGRAGGPLDDPNDLAYFFAAAVPLAVALSAQGGAAARLRWLAAAGVLVVGIASTFSRGAVLALVVLLGWGLARGLVRVRAAAVGAGVLALALLGLATTYPGVIDESLHQKQHIASRNVDTRTLRWAAALRMTADAPVLGLGPGGFTQNYPRYPTPGKPDDDTVGIVAHEMYLEVASELGVPAAVAFLGLLVSAVRAARRVALGRAGPGSPPFDRTLALGVQGSLLAIASASLFLTEQYYLPLWLMIAAALALESRSRAT